MASTEVQTCVLSHNYTEVQLHHMHPLQKTVVDHCDNIYSRQSKKHALQYNVTRL